MKGTEDFNKIMGKYETKKRGVKKKVEGTGGEEGTLTVVEVHGEDKKVVVGSVMWGLVGILWVPSLSQEDSLAHILVSTLLVSWDSTAALFL